ncbi:MAG: molybdenum cofactor guanylyltransferase [Halieaceae bacterium]
MGATAQLKGVAILCGGDSRRMGTDKALVDFDGMPLLRRHVEAILSLNLDAPIYISSGTKRYEILDDYGVVYAPDVVAGAGPLSGLAGALIAAEGAGSSGGHVFAMPVDTLVPPRVLLDTLTKAGLGASGVALIKGQRLHPVHGLFPLSAAAALSGFVQSGGRAVMEFLETLDIEEVSIGEAWESCLNFNYPEDFVAARDALVQITSLNQ